MDSDANDSRLANETTSKTNLIEVQHVGVTAKMPAPMKKVPPECSSGEPDLFTEFFKKSDKTNYNKLNGEDTASTALTTPPVSGASVAESSPKLLYEMHAEQKPRRCTFEPRKSCLRSSNHNHGHSHSHTHNPYSRIEFQLYNSSSKRRRCCRCQRSGRNAKRRPSVAGREYRSSSRRPSFFKRLRNSLREMCASKAPILSTSFSDTQQSLSGKPPSCGVYKFEHGCADFLQVTDGPPHVVSNVLAERATYFATRFWAEFFGGLHIGVSFCVTFLLQTYRFVLYSLINTLLVGALQMTSDYFLKPMLTVIFNGFLQPPFIFIFNILNSFRDLMKPIAETINNFMKPVATVGRSLRLVQATYTKKKFVKDV